MYELYGDVERLIPDHITPQCVEKMVEIEEYVREERRKKASPKKGPKRKRNDAVERNIPDGASKGFVSVRDLVTKGSKKKKKEIPLDLDALGCEDGKSDEDLESGRIIPLTRRTQSAAAGQPSEKQAPKSKLKKSATNVPRKAPKPRKKQPVQLTSSQISQLGVDDSDDLDLESGIVMPSLKSQLHASTSKPSKLTPTPEPSPPKPSTKFVDRSLIELTDSEHEESAPTTHNDNYDDQDDLPTFDYEMDVDQQGDHNMSWLVDDDDDARCDFEIVDSSPIAPKPTSKPLRPTLERMQIGDESLEISSLRREDDEVIPDSDPFAEPVVEDWVTVESPKGKLKAPAKRLAFSTVFRPSSVLISPSRKSNTPEPSVRFAGSSKLKSSPAVSWPSSPANEGNANTKGSMLPPALPQRFLESPGNTSMEAPEPTYPVRQLGRAPKRRRLAVREPESPVADLEIPPVSQRRLHRIESTPQRSKAAAMKTKRTKRALPSLLARSVNPLFDGEADHSGDEVSEGCSDEDEESESDRQFIKNSPATQVSQSYDQTLIYRRSLMTQAQGEGSSPLFSNGPMRAQPFGRTGGARARFLPSSSPPPPDEELDHYHLGSFVVDDEEDISYEM